MSFLASLKSSTDSPKSAYLQFVTQKRKGDYLAFAFVEDEDDIQFYQHVLSCYSPIAYFGCGGKTGVFEVFYHLRDNNQDRGNLFMVDRDHELAPYEPDGVLRTEPYSWEAHLCAPGIIASFLQRRARPPLGNHNLNKVRERWVSTLDQFRELITTHAALLSLRHEPGQELGLGDVRLDKGIADEGVLRPSQVDVDLIHEKHQASGISDVESRQIDEIREKCAGQCPSVIGHGKMLFSIVRKFLPTATDGLGCQPVTGVNSPKQILAATPWDYSDFDYIRTYAQVRMAQNDNEGAPH